MTVEDLQHIFREQIDLGADLFFALEEDSRLVIERHRLEDGLNGLLPLLDNFVYDGDKAGMSRFVKL